MNRNPRARRLVIFLVVLAAAAAAAWIVGPFASAVLRMHGVHVD